MAPSRFRVYHDSVATFIPSAIWEINTTLRRSSSIYRWEVDFRAQFISIKSIIIMSLSSSSSPLARISLAEFDSKLFFFLNLTLLGKWAQEPIHC